MWVWSFPAGLQSISLLGTYKADSKPLISLSHDVNVYIFKVLFIHTVCARARACAPAYVYMYVCMCTMSVGTYGNQKRASNPQELE